MSEQQGERLQKVLAHAGVASRRAVEEMIAAGRITVNGKKARLGQRIDPSKDEVKVDGSRVRLEEDLVYLLLNKPVGTVTSASDPQGREVAVDLVDTTARVWPVGRLDIDSEGALLLTNDGDLTHRLTHPSFGVPKTYVVRTQGSVPERALRQLLREGVDLEDGPAKATSARLLERTAGGSLVEITIKQGRNRQVRRMFEALGFPVRGLVRTAIGPLTLGRLKPGTYRRLGRNEVMELYRAVGL